MIKRDKMEDEDETEGVYENEKLRLKIEQEKDPTDPREIRDNLGIMVAFHKRYNLGDKTDLTSDQFNSWDELKEYLIKHEKAKVILPLYLLDHGGLAMRTEPFFEDPGGWDSGQVGFIYTTDKRIKEFYGDKKPSEKEIEEALESEVRDYNDYLEGNVYRFVLEKKEKCNLGYIHTELLDLLNNVYGSPIGGPDEEEVLDFLNNYVTVEKDLGVTVEKDLEPYLEDLKKKVAGEKIKA